MIAALIRRKQTYFFLASLALACLVFWANQAIARAQTSPVPMPNPPTPVVDNADVIDDATEKRLDDLLKNLSENRQANVEMGVVTVKTTGGQEIFDYSLAIMRGWGIGLGEKGGLLLVVAIEDRKAYVQVSRHLEGDITDSLAGEIQRRYLVPSMRAGNYSKAIYDTTMAFVATLAEKRGFSVEGIDRSYANGSRSGGTRAPQRSGRGGGGGISTCTILFIIAFILILLLSNRGRGGGGGSGCLNMLLLGSLLNSGRGGGWSGGGFGGSSGWGGGGGGGGGWGGFSGGGGDAGGGGAGSSW